MCTVSNPNAPLTQTFHGSTPTTRPSCIRKPPGWFIQPFTATTDAVLPMPARTTGTPDQKCGHGAHAPPRRRRKALNGEGDAVGGSEPAHQSGPEQPQLEGQDGAGEPHLLTGWQEL
jgi:hypothetical protein